MVEGDSTAEFRFILSVLQILSQLKTRRTWAHFRARWCCNPYPHHYSTAFASSDIPNPQTLGTPYGLLSYPTTVVGVIWGFHVPLPKVCGVRFSLSTGRFIGCVDTIWRCLTINPYLLVQACKPLPLVYLYGLYHEFRYLNHTHYLAITQFVVTRRKIPSQFFSRSIILSFFTLSGSLFIQSPRFTQQHGWSL